jgi:hypothetical protein
VVLIFVFTYLHRGIDHDKGYLTREWKVFDATMNEAGTAEARRRHLLRLTMLPF